MRLGLTVTFFALSVLSASAQDPVESFQQRAFDLAATPGDTRIPILCGGLFRALALMTDQDADTQVAFQEREEVAIDIGIVVHMLDMLGTEIQIDEAKDFITGGISQVSAVYREWLSFNRETEQVQVTDRIAENFRYCDGYYVDWIEVDSEN